MNIASWVRGMDDESVNRNTHLSNVLVDAIKAEVGAGDAVPVTWPSMAPTGARNRGILVHLGGKWLLLTAGAVKVADRDEDDDRFGRLVHVQHFGALTGLSVKVSRRYAADSVGVTATLLHGFEVRHEAFPRMAVAGRGRLKVDVALLGEEERESLLESFLAAADLA